MKFVDPDRPKLANGLPAWRDSKGMIALPTVDISPGGDGGEGELHRWNVRIMHGGNGRWYFTTVGEGELRYFLQEWRDDPEKTFEDFFAAEAPREIEYGKEGRVVEKVVVANIDVDF